MFILLIYFVENYLLEFKSFGFYLFYKSLTSLSYFNLINIQIRVTGTRWLAT